MMHTVCTYNKATIEYYVTKGDSSNAWFLNINFFIFSGGERFLNTCVTTQYADDITLGAIIGKQGL